MRNRADIYRQKAHECERAADRVADPQVQASYRQMSRQWNEMAQRQQTIDEALAELLKPLECGADLKSDPALPADQRPNRIVLKEAALPRRCQ